MKLAMKIAGAALAMLVSAEALAAQDLFALWDGGGTYKGTGKFREQTGRSGKYEITSEFSEKDAGGKRVVALKTTSKLDGRTQTWTVYFADEKNGFFNVLDSSNMKVIGEGFCFESQCQISVSSVTTKLLETFTFHGPTLTVLGIRNIGGQRSVWHEIMLKQ
ncbi:MAG TPA: hypothetical protein VFV50_13030 [Bdellovibrionales bacterium]|nr:hypothetical protein [Bdellovibrionales bacterium]